MDYCKLARFSKINFDCIDTLMVLAFDLHSRKVKSAFAVEISMSRLFK